MSRANSSSWEAGAVIGLLVAAITALGLAPLAMPASYSWVELGLSEAAAQGIAGAWVARTGFVLFGLAVLWLAALCAGWSRPASLSHRGFAVAMIGVAVFAHKPWDPAASFVASEDRLHSVFATIVGFGFIGGVTLVLIGRERRTVRNAAPDVVALAVALAVPLLMSSAAWGVLQRLMFLTAAVWYGLQAWSGTTSHRTRFPGPSGETTDRCARSCS